MLLPSLPSLASYQKGIGGVAVAQTGPPVSVVAPFVSGTAFTGETLSCNGGSWSGAPPIVLTFQWTRDTVEISGETASTYLLDVADEDADIVCVVTATNGDGNDSADSNTVVPTAGPQAPANSVAPAVTGNAFTGQTLSCSTGTWSQSPTSYAYQWKRAGANIAAATASTYVVVLADVGQSVKCTVTASNAVGAGTPTDSNAVTPVGIPVNSVAPAVTGTTTVGSTLSCSNGTWSGSPSFTFQWKRDGVSIGGATSNTYLLDALDETTSIKCTVGASNLAGAGTSTDSNTVGPITAAPDDLPGIFGAKLYAGWEARAITASDNDALATWEDVSTNNRDLTQGTGANQPLYKTNIDGSEPAVRFDGSDDALSMSVGSPLVPAWVLWVGKFRSTTAAAARVFFGSRSSSDKVRVENGTAPQPISVQFGANLFPDVPSYTDAWHDDFHFWMFKITTDGTTTATLDDDTSTPDNSGTHGIETTFCLGAAEATFGTQAADVDIIACVILDSAPSAGEITDFRTRYSV